MASITSGPEFHAAPPPGASSASTIEQDAPALLGLHHEAPKLHIYTASTIDFDILNRTNDRSVTTLPVATVRPTDETEVSTAVQYISQNGLTLAIRNSGVDQGGRSLAFGPKAVSVDVRSMDKMVLSADKRVVTIGGGVSCGSLLQFLESHGLTTPTAFSTTVGYVGWGCGGGYSMLNGVMGLGVDNILGGRVVLADGRIMDTDDADCDPDLLWALRGGGAGIVGVVASLRVRVHRCPDCLAGNIVFPVAETPRLAEGLNKLYAWKKPAKFAGDAAIVNPNGDGGLLSFLFFWALEEDRSDLDEAKEYLERILGFGSAIVNTVKETTPYGFTMGIPNPKLYQDLIHIRKTVSVPGWSVELGRIISEPLPTATSLVVIHDSHGAGTRASNSAFEENGAFLNREPHLMIGFFPSAHPNDEEGLRKSRVWADKLFNDTTAAGFVMPPRYINFASPEKGDGICYYGAQGLTRIKSIKGRLDPLNVFAKSTPDLVEIEDA
ncbi:hypothetical protein ACHAQJ_007674 [Trichoderma viride]